MKRWVTWVAGGLAVLLLLLLALVGFLSMTRGTPIERVVSIGRRSGVPPAIGDSLFARTVELYSSTHIDAGNEVEILNNGEVYPPLWRDLRSARQSITVQLYYAQPGRVADSLMVVLSERARAGVRVLVLLDAFGAGTLTKEWKNALKSAGVTVAFLRPLRWYELHKTNFRSHVRVVAVDGRIGYTGGFGLADYWLGDGVHDEQWRDTNVRFTGPAVEQLQAAFAAAWAEATGELIAGDIYFPRRSPVTTGGVQAGLFFATPTMGSTAAERFMVLTIASARHTLYISNSYFVADDDFRRLLIEAVKRGVDVRLLTAGDKSDVRTTTWAARARYDQLIDGGVRIWEYDPTMMHSKTLVADGVWSMIGSMNFDNRSLAMNNESNLVVLDARIGAAMDSLYARDLTHSHEITLQWLDRRSVFERTMEGLVNLLSRVL